MGKCSILRGKLVGSLGPLGGKVHKYLMLLYSMILGYLLAFPSKYCTFPLSTSESLLNGSDILAYTEYLNPYHLIPFYSLPEQLSYTTRRNEEACPKYFETELLFIPTMVQVHLCDITKCFPSKT